MSASYFPTVSFSKRNLVLSDDQLVEWLITDIPFFALGLLGFAVATFLFSLRKLTKPSLYIIASIFFAFVAAILDFNQLLQRSNENVIPPSKNNIIPLTIARELGYSISVCARFLFFWHFSALPPRGEVVIPPRQPIRALPGNAEPHSASYSQWGAFGVLLNWIHLLAAIAIGVLQILWRITSLPTFDPVYLADGYLQIALSTLFVVKLLCNVWFAPLTPRWKTLYTYSPILVAIMVGKGVAIGNQIFFKFSEMSLGRFLQAIELYILALYILISACHHDKKRSSMMVEGQERSRHRSAFQGLPGRSSPVSTFRVSPPTVSTPDIPNEVPQRPAAAARMSTAERLASWLSQRLAAARNERDQTRLWNQNDVEAAIPVDEKARSVISFGEASPMEPSEVAMWKDPIYSRAQVPSPSIPKSTTTPPPRTTPIRISDTARSSLQPPSPIFRVTADYSQNSRVISRMSNGSHTESPIYGFDTPPRRIKTERTEDQLSSSLESLMRQQDELDKSVAALKLFTPNPSPSPFSNGELRPAAGPVRTESESYRSEFSLGNFPSPPIGSFYPDNGSSSKSYSLSGSADGHSVPDVPSLPRPSTSTSGPEDDEEVIVDEDIRFTLMPPRMPIAVEDQRQSLPSTARDSLPEFMNGGESNRGDSGVTQYNVTSFIGDLTTPRVGGYPSSIITGLADLPPSSVPQSPSMIEEDATVKNFDLEDRAPPASRNGPPGDVTVPRAVKQLKVVTTLPSSPRPVPVSSTDASATSTLPRYTPFSAGRPRLIGTPFSRPDPLDTIERPRPAPSVSTLSKPGVGQTPQDGNATGKFI